MKRLRNLVLTVLGARGGAFAMVQVVVAQSFLIVVNLATGILTARLLGPTGRGEFATASLWLLLPSLLALAGLGSGIVYESGRAPERRAAVGLAASLIGTAAFIGTAAIALWFLPALMHGYDPGVIALSQAATLVSVVNVWYVVVRQCLLAERDFRAYNVLNTSSPIVYLALLGVLALAGSVTPATAIWTQVLATVLVLPLGLWRLVRGWRGLSLRPGGSVRPLLLYSARAAPAEIASIFAYNVDRLVLVAFVSPAELGLYVAAAAFARILGFLQTAVSVVTLADLAGKPLDVIERSVHLTFRLLAIILVVGCGGAVLVDTALLRVAYGPEFVQAAPIFRVLLIEAALSCLGGVLLQAFLAAGRPAVTSTVQVASLAVTVGGMFALVPGSGAQGAAAALALGALARLLLLLGGLRYIGMRLPRPVPGPGDVALLRDRLQRRRAARNDLERAD